MHGVTIKKIAVYCYSILSSTLRFKNNLFRRDRHAIYQNLSIMKKVSRLSWDKLCSIMEEKGYTVHLIKQ